MKHKGFGHLKTWLFTIKNLIRLEILWVGIWRIPNLKIPHRCLCLMQPGGASFTRAWSRGGIQVTEYMAGHLDSSHRIQSTDSENRPKASGSQQKFERSETRGLRLLPFVTRWSPKWRSPITREKATYNPKRVTRKNHPRSPEGCCPFHR